MKQLERLLEVVARLRDPVKGCPWDSVQTNMSIRHYLVEEAGEYLDALESGDDHAVKDELGDLLLQVVLNSRIAEEEGRFSIEDVAESEADKMIRRHPHVFGESNAKTEDELRSQWERIKHTEKGYDTRKSAIDGVPRSVPALMRAQKMLQKAGKAGFEWRDFDSALGKVDEELAELKSALAGEDKEHIAEELGDLLLSIVKICQLKELHAEELLQASVAKFAKRFRTMESSLEYNMKERTADQLLAAWESAKNECGR